MAFTESPYRRGKVLDEHRRRQNVAKYGETTRPELPDGWEYETRWEQDPSYGSPYDGVGRIVAGVGYGPDIVQLCDPVCEGEHSRYVRPHENHRYWEPDEHFPTFEQFRDWAMRGASRQVAREAYEQHKRECAEWLDEYVDGFVVVEIVDTRGTVLGSASIGEVEESWADDAADDYGLYGEALEDARRNIAHQLATYSEYASQL